MHKISDKRHVIILVNTLVAKGLRYVISSPGSRNAPLMISFKRHPKVVCISIPDERSAAFFALGMAQYLNEPVGLVCTSGTAGLNYSPGLAEAYYQMIPIIAITADRPNEYADQADGQTIVQKNIFGNYIKGSFQIPQEEGVEDAYWHTNRIANEAFNRSVYPQAGPVHINIPLREPLYETVENNDQVRTIEVVRHTERLDPDTVDRLRNILAGFSKIMILNGQLKPKAALDGLVQKSSLRNDTVVLAESLSNFSGEMVIPCIDRTLLSIPEDRLEEYGPDLLITFDGPVISKKIKVFLRRFRPVEHWHIGNHRTDLDTYQSLTRSIMCSRTFFVDEVLNKSEKKSSNYSDMWTESNRKSQKNHTEFLQKAVYSDLTVFHSITSLLPAGVHLHLGNSSIVRYFQLFDNYPKMPQFGNRGTSGIDGCTSTAAGYAFASKAMSLLITGDLSFFYDTNGLWHRHLSANLRIIMINNGGGGIFKIIAGPNTVEERDELFVAEQITKAKDICRAYSIDYFSAQNIGEVESVLSGSFFSPADKPKLLEILTPKDSHISLHAYFNHLKAER